MRRALGPAGPPPVAARHHQALPTLLSLPTALRRHLASAEKSEVSDGCLGALGNQHLQKNTPHLHHQGPLPGSHISVNGTSTHPNALIKKLESSWTLLTLLPSPLPKYQWAINKESLVIEEPPKFTPTFPTKEHIWNRNPTRMLAKSREAVVQRVGGVQGRGARKRLAFFRQWASYPSSQRIRFSQQWQRFAPNRAKA
ncbi:hypothetical protein VULLAG_LOCUS14987 [Vulpes lagopus]